MFPIIATLSQIGGILVDKIVLTRRQVSLRVFVPLLFLFLFLFSMVLFPFLGTISHQMFTPYYIIIFILMIVTAIIWNVFYYRGVQQEKMNEFELIIMFQPLFTIILAAVFLRGEQSVHTIIAAIIAAIALILAHLQKKHLEFSAGAISLILAVIFMSVELILIKILLVVFSPVALYMVRTAIIFIFFYFYYKPDIFRVANTNVALILSSAALGVVQMVTKFYGFEKYGVVYTSLVLIAAPLVIYFFSSIFLHEKIKPRVLIAALVILLCIVYATVLGK